jgi:hypothetical protein
MHVIRARGRFVKHGQSAKLMARLLAFSKAIHGSDPFIIVLQYVFYRMVSDSQTYVVAPTDLQPHTAGALSQRAGEGRCSQCRSLYRSAVDGADDRVIELDRIIELHEAGCTQRSIRYICKPYRHSKPGATAQEVLSDLEAAMDE